MANLTYLKLPDDNGYNVDITSQTATTTNSNYEVLFSGTADNTTRSEGARKTSTFKYNPSTKSIQIGNLASNTTLGSYSIAVGDSNTASANYTAAFGYNNTVSGQRGFAEGYNNTISGGWGGHVEGGGNTVTADGGHAEGSGNIVHGYYAHAEGNSNQALAKAQHVFGEYNIADSDLGYWRGTYVEIVGNGTADDARSNARTLDWSGNEWLAGGLTIGNTAIPSGAELSNTYSSITNNSIVLQNNYTTPTSVNRSQTMTILPTDITVAGESEISGSWIGGQTSLRGALSWVSNNAVAKSGDTMTGHLVMDGGNVQIKNVGGRLQMYGGEIHLGTTDSSSDDSGDLVWYYGNGQEKCRLFTNNLPTVAKDAGIRFRAFAKDGSDLITTTTLLTRRDIQTISNSVRWKSTTTSFSQVSGLSFSVPAYSVAIVTAQQMWSNAIPRAIGIGTGTGNSLVALNTNTSDDSNLGGCHISTTGTIINNGSTAITYYVYCSAKTVSTTGNDVKIKGIIIPYGA